MNQVISMRTVALAVTLIVLCAGSASASYKHCYGGCLFHCVLKLNNPAKCAVECLFKCIGKNSEDANKLDLCQSCALTQCTRFMNGEFVLLQNPHHSYIFVHISTSNCMYKRISCVYVNHSNLFIFWLVCRWQQVRWLCQHVCQPTMLLTLISLFCASHIIVWK